MTLWAEDATNNFITFLAVEELELLPLPLPSQELLHLTQAADSHLVPVPQLLLVELLELADLPRLVASPELELQPLEVPPLPRWPNSNHLSRSSDFKTTPSIRKETSTSPS